MNNMMNVCYDNTFLKQVIFRIDFAKPISSEKIFCESIVAAIQTAYPRIHKEEIIRFGQIKVDVKRGAVSDCISQDVSEGRQKTFISENQMNKLVLANNYIIFETNKYGSYESLRTAALVILSAIFEIDDVVVARIGLRYINIFNSPDNAKITKTMFVPTIRATMNPKPLDLSDLYVPVRSITLTEYRYNDIRINYRSGILNQAFPARMKNDSYIIDVDCFVEGGISCKNDVYGFLEEGHAAIQSMFEKSITDDMRKIMGTKNE